MARVHQSPLAIVSSICATLAPWFMRTNTCIFRYKNALMALVEATPESFNVKGTINIASKTGPSWLHPVIPDRKLYLRANDVLLCCDISSGS